MSNTTTTVAQIAANSLSAVRVFEKWGIDYCCGGKRPLAGICLDKGLDAAAIEAELNSTSPDPSGQPNWNQAPLADLIEHLLSTHHEYLRRELPVLAARLEKVYRVYNQRYGPTLTGLPEVFAALREELETHLQKEEQVLFPALIVGEAARKTGTQPPPTCFGAVANPIRMMEAEHASASQGLERIREITAGFHIPDYACVTYRALMYGLEELESDLQLHMHLENNILFPRAIRLEAALR